MSSETPPPGGRPDPLLTPAQRATFERYITSKSSLIGKCPVCSQRNWGILDHLVHLPVYWPGGGLVIGGAPLYPNVGLICQNCGNTQLINAVMAGVVVNENPEETK